MPALGILPVGGLALLLGVERFKSEIRAATNLFSKLPIGCVNHFPEHPSTISPVHTALRGGSLPLP